MGMYVGTANMSRSSEGSIGSKEWEALGKRLQGELVLDDGSRLNYATDASVYRKWPVAVAFPKGENDWRHLLLFAQEHGVPLIPRAAGTSLAGQVVGAGIVVDAGRHNNRILEVNEAGRWVRVEPGVVRDELNLHLKPYGLMFAPETATSNRCMIGGMIGNNSCGSRSVVFGTTRDHVLEVKAMLSDGSIADFGPLTPNEYREKTRKPGLEGDLYRHLDAWLSAPEEATLIETEYPRKDIRRRNTGYAVDVLLGMQPFSTEGEPFNLAKLLCGSEGTLSVTLEAKLNLVPVLPPVQGVVPVHLDSVDEAMLANLIALRFGPTAVELIDRNILRCTAGNPEQSRNRSFVQGDPGALLAAEFCCADENELQERARALEEALRQEGFGYAFPLLRGAGMKAVWDLRQAGLGLLANMPGDPKPVACIEDTCVHVSDQPAYIAEVRAILNRLGLDCVFYAHIGDGEIHLRPVLDLKSGRDRQLFRQVTAEVAALVKRFRGSLSGEHGDGRVRGEWLRLMVGDVLYERLVGLKRVWDPSGILNPGKIVEVPPMDTDLRYENGQQTRHIDTVFDFSSTQGLLRMAEKCNGTAVCRKSHLMGGTMCPSYMATRDEGNTTRARANQLREWLTRSDKANPFDQEELKAVMDLCLSCKACRSECPSNVDMARMKAEFLQHYYDANGIPFRAWVFAHYARIQSLLGSLSPSLVNGMWRVRWIAGCIKRIIGIDSRRSIPALARRPLRRLIASGLRGLNQRTSGKRELWLFVDEFTQWQDARVGWAAIEVLTALDYRVKVMPHPESARAMISKGLLRKARAVAIKQVSLWADRVSGESPLVGIEPSAILGFRDEFPDLVGDDLRHAALELASHSYTFEGFLARELDAGRIDRSRFKDEKATVVVHGHCQQKALEGTAAMVKALSLPPGYQVKMLASGCCGMAGSFGYEKEHYDLSMRIGELVLFPEVRRLPDGAILCAAGTSCRHQVLDGTGRMALHPAEVLRDALREANKSHGS